MTDNADSPSPQNTDPDAEYFAKVTSGIYRRVEPESVWRAVQYAVRHKLPGENPMIMIMLVRIAEVYSEVHAFLSDRLADANEQEQTALNLILDPPGEIRNAQYLPDEIQSPGEMDMCWGEFLVTGSTEPVEKIMAVLDRDDVSRVHIDSLLSAEECQLELDDGERENLANVGIALGHSGGPWKVMSRGDVDLLLWFGLKDQNPTCSKIAKLLNEDQLLHVATKGAGLWSLKANANQHGKIQQFCVEQAKIEGGVGRQLILPTA